VRIFQAYQNYYNSYKWPNNSLPPSVQVPISDSILKQKSFVDQQWKWMQEMAQAANSSDKDYNYWKQVEFAMDQFDGIVAGYRDHSPKEQVFEPA
jgi:hypothetical protein